MIQGKATLVIDLGNSSTKGTVIYGVDAQTGKRRERSFDIPNIFAPIREDYEVSSDYNDATSTILSVDTTLNGHDVKGLFCNGEIQQAEFPLSTIKPSASGKKYNLDATVLSYRLAFLYACRALMNMQRVSDYKQIDVDWTVVTLLPPGDLAEGKDAIINIVQSIDRVTAVYPNVDIPIKISKVAVLPEGYCAYVAVVYNIGNTFRADYKYLTDETVLVIDIGAGTSDILVMKKNKLVQETKYTITQGGNNVFQYVRKKLRRVGLDIDDSDIRNGIIKGFVKDGSKQLPISDIVNEAKAHVAQIIVSEVQDFLDETSLKARSVGYVLVCGGGSMQDSEAPDILPLSEKVISSFKQFAPNSELIEIPTHVVIKTLDDGDIEKVEEQINPRELNLLGASILADVI